MNKRRGIIYGVLVTLLLFIGVWWVYFLTMENDARLEFERQKQQTDRMHAIFLLQSNPQMLSDPRRYLGDNFPHLIFRETDQGMNVLIDPAYMQAAEDKARRVRNMFLYEGLTFMVLLLAGSTILVLSWRSESRFVAARELFLAGATHEFKTPLASLQLYTETLGREGLSEENRQRIRGRMVQDIRRLEHLVDEVLSLSAADTFRPGPRVVMDLKELSQGVIDELRGFAGDNGAVIQLESEAQVRTEGQEVAFNLTLRNLIVNAIRHNDPGVRVTVKLERRRNWNLLTVQDDGRGIPRRLHDKVFECFYSDSRNARPDKGAGVGLYLVRRNVTSMGGKIKIDSDEGKGCTFSIMLPAHKGEKA
ncbi:hypothetical protein CSB20_04460 [bacterium DOLZORAL124_64_63]|nr:MAG: hypothetical protein CSB20_04460 [bacterium DOLZORAL124_64_63]